MEFEAACVDYCDLIAIRTLNPVSRGLSAVKILLESRTGFETCPDRATGKRGFTKHLSPELRRSGLIGIAREQDPADRATRRKERFFLSPLNTRSECALEDRTTSRMSCRIRNVMLTTCCIRPLRVSEIIAWQLDFETGGSFLLT